MAICSCPRCNSRLDSRHCFYEGQINLDLPSDSLNYRCPKCGAWVISSKRTGEVHSYSPKSYHDEYCPDCDDYVHVPPTGGYCKGCGRWILPCNMCDTDLVHCNDCPFEQLKPISNKKAPKKTKTVKKTASKAKASTKRRK